jgi:hypothetical protein
MCTKKIAFITLFFSITLSAMPQVPVIPQEPVLNVLATVDEARVQVKQERWAEVLDQRAWRRKMSWVVLGALGVGVTYSLIRLWFPAPTVPINLPPAEKDFQFRYRELLWRELEDEMVQRSTWFGFTSWCFKNGVRRGIELGGTAFLVAIATRALSSSQSLLSSTFDRISGFNEDVLLTHAIQATMRNSSYLSRSWEAVLKAAAMMDPACEALYGELLYRIAIDAYAFIDSFESCCAFINAALECRGPDDAGIALQKAMARAMRLVNDGMIRQQAAYLLAVQQLTPVTSGSQPAALQASSIMMVNQSVQGELLRFFQEAGSVLYDIDCMSLLAGTEHGTN